MKLRAQQIQMEIESMHYWDARVLQLDSSFFGDEVELIFEDTDFNVKLFFTGCSKLSFVTSAEDRMKPLRNLTKPQIPYFIQDVEVSEVQIEGQDLLNCKILMPPLHVDIVCNSITVQKV